MRPFGLREPYCSPREKKQWHFLYKSNLKMSSKKGADTQTESSSINSSKFSRFFPRSKWKKMGIQIFVKMTVIVGVTELQPSTSVHLNQRGNHTRAKHRNRRLTMCGGHSALCMGRQNSNRRPGAIYYLFPYRFVLIPLILPFFQA